MLGFRFAWGACLACLGGVLARAKIRMCKKSAACRERFYFLGAPGVAMERGTRDCSQPRVFSGGTVGVQGDHGGQLPATGCSDSAKLADLKFMSSSAGSIGLNLPIRSAGGCSPPLPACSSSRGERLGDLANIVDVMRRSPGFYEVSARCPLYTECHRGTSGEEQSILPNPEKQDT